MTSRGGRLAVELPADIAGQVRLLSQRLGVTPFVTLLTAFAVVLARYAAQDDLIIGVPVANREQRGVDQIIGPFLNTLALRVELAGAPTFLELSQQISRTFLAGLEHQETPFERVLQVVQNTRDPSRSQLFQAVFNFQIDQSSAGTQLRDLPNGGCDFDLLLDIVSTTAGAMTAHIDYYADVYDEASVGRFADAFRNVLRAAVTGAELPVTELALMPPDAWDSVVQKASVTAMPYDRACSVPELVLGQVAGSFDKVAIVDHERLVTYGEVADRSAAVAAELVRRIGVPPAAQVAICLPRSADMIVAILGVLRAGFSYVPLDPEHPAQRLAFICHDAGIAAVVTRADMQDALPPTDVPIIHLEELRARDDLPAGSSLPPADRCAYTIYTSGSTGQPKGVEVSHRNVVNFLKSMSRSPGLGADDVLLAVTSPSFDISILEMLLPLTVGARTIVASPSEATDGRRLADLLEQQQVTVMQGTPATWQLMVESGWPGRPGLRALCGGETFPPALAGALLTRCGEVWNMYGPTETTIWSTIHRVTVQDVSSGCIPIGRPIANTTAFVLDAGLNPVPPGFLGELYLGGDGVSIGYHQRPDLTTSRFVVPPFFAGQRLYRTGDLVRARVDGTLEFAGRNDHQVKVRGFRIELGEIEAVLGSHPLVARAVAAVGDTAEKPIVAYVEPSGTQPVPQNDLQAFAAARLPEYMVPDRIVVLDRLPLMTNGKIDRSRLSSLDPRPEAGPEEAARPGFVAPRTEAELAVAAIWQDLLGLSEVGVHENFFELGGHSLLATKLVFRIRTVLGVDLPLNAIFDGEPTVSRLALLLTEGADSSSTVDAALDLAAEARLADDISPTPGAHVHSGRHPQHIFLTGATGFVGAFLLAELLNTTDAAVFCLVRAPSYAEGNERIRGALTDYGIWDPAFTDRIIAVPGTLSHPRLGLSRPQWQHLAAMVDAIYHCGAEVDFLKKYQALKAANVSGTAEVLRLACDGAVKPVHFVSSIYVYSRFSYPPGTEFMEDMEPIHDLEYTFGYTQSKWVSERMVVQAGHRGLPVYVYRLGQVAGHSKTGACQTYDFVWQVTKVGIELGAAPIMDITLDLTPVDFVVSALAHLSRQPGLRGQVFHLLSPEHVPEHVFVTWLEQHGYHAERLTFNDWCQRVVQRAAELSDTTAGALAPFLSGAVPLDQIPLAHFDRSNLERGLAGTTISCPVIDDELVGTYLNYFRDSGYLPQPEPALVGSTLGGTGSVPGKDSR
jgi:amino acid adenylation domain-containing protein/thioester reductase-like protein